MWKEALSQKCDILCIQEMHLCKLNPPSHKAFPYLVFANVDKKKRGILIAVRYTVSSNHLSLEIDPGGRYIILGAFINNHKFTIVNLYAPNIHQK